MKSTIALLKQQNKFAAEQAYSQRFQEVMTTDLTNYQASETEMSAKYNMKRIWTVILLLFLVLQFHENDLCLS